MMPKLRKLLIVSPKYFGMHFLPLYNLKILVGTPINDERAIRRRFTHIGLKYLIAYCHGVTVPHICEWSGKSEADVHKDILDSLDGFVNTIPYWIWAYRVDMRAVPFTQNKRSRAKFSKRLKIWNGLNERPQFIVENKAKRLLPKYLHSPEALSYLPKKSPKRSTDYLLTVVPKNGPPPNKTLHP
tara:strand:- start:4700 stop:5254 length:555 start_codon:yes stop_codon:yes gene_type:complete